MWIKTSSKTFPNLKKDVVWKILIDINNWPSWHNDLEYCKLTGEFKVGNVFLLKPKGAPEVKIELIKIDPGNSFTDCTSFLGAKMYDDHILEESEQGLKITNIVRVTGWLSWLWIKLVANGVANSAEEQIECLAKLAKNK